MKFYENVAIGNFLYGLGFAVGKRVVGNDFPTIVNLLQQTPDDKLLGDVLFRSPGLLRVFEFKQRNNKSDKEQKRQAELKSRLENQDAMHEISRKVHWFVETAAEEKTFFSRIVPYLDAYPVTEDRHDFGEFVNRTADAVVGKEEILDESSLNQYLMLLVTLHDAQDVGSGGLIVRISETGQIHYAELTSVLDLIFSREHVLHQQNERSMAQALERKRLLSREIERGGHER